ncbi:hypothetical protein NQ315_013093 [Exocentrus adspersus]|uniref:Uncharacterized protein n=1 Tax=Exocentrus adspersus TaxID=1586481 RepID=A0AAV8VWE7_9CUCU|nr:hypothetical protein NQ315_013093 [Exocentrus adspersus]
MELLHAAVCALILTCVTCQDLHVIDTKPGQCFRVHTPDQPVLNLNPPEARACTQWLRENKNCLGLRTQNGEVVVVFCKDDQKRRRAGCYKLINKDKREEVVCQKLNRQQGCEVITTRSNLTVVVHCQPLARGASNVGGGDNRSRKQKG